MPRSRSAASPAPRGDVNDHDDVVLPLQVVLHQQRDVVTPRPRPSGRRRLSVRWLRAPTTGGRWLESPPARRGSAKTISPRRRRSSEPSAATTSSPNVRETSASPAEPAATASRASSSASITTAPRVGKQLATVALAGADPPGQSDPQHRRHLAWAARGLRRTRVRPLSARSRTHEGPPPQTGAFVRRGSVAGELLAQRGERLVGSQRALGRVRGRGRRRVTSQSTRRMRGRRRSSWSASPGWRQPRRQP